MGRTTNEVHLIGHAGKDALVKSYGDGKKLSKFSLATGGGKNKETGKEYPTDWHQIVCFDVPDADRVSKGDLVEVYGRIQYGSYEKDGRTVYTTDIIAKQVTIGAGAEDGGF